MQLSDLALLVFLAAMIPLTLFMALSRLLEHEILVDYAAAAGLGVLAIVWSVATVGLYGEALGTRVAFLWPTIILWVSGALIAATAQIVVSRLRVQPLHDFGSDDGEAVLVYLDDESIPEEYVEEYDVAGLEDLLSEAIEPSGLGVYDGDELTEAGWTLFMYGPSAEAIFAAVEPVLQEYPLGRNARVELRFGGPDAASREVKVGAA